MATFIGAYDTNAESSQATLRKATISRDGTKDRIDVLPADSNLEIARGNISNMTFIHKFGRTPDFDKGDGEVTVWDGADDSTADQMVYQFSSTADIDSLVSSNAGDTQDIEVQGLDTNFDLVTQTITLNGQTRVALTTDLIRVFRLKNVGSTDIAGNVYCYVDSSITSGVPDDSTKIRAMINDGNNQTLMAVYTIPNGKTGYMGSFYASVAGPKKSSNYIIKLKARPTGEVFQLKNVNAISDTGNSHMQHFYNQPEVFAAKTDIIITAEITASGITAAAVSAGFDIILVDN